MSLFRLIENPLKSRLCLEILFAALELEQDKKTITKEALKTKLNKSTQSIGNALMAMAPPVRREEKTGKDYLFIRKEYEDERYKYYEIDFDFLANKLTGYILDFKEPPATDGMRFEYYQEAIMDRIFFSPKEKKKFVCESFSKIKKIMPQLELNDIPVESIQDVFIRYKTITYLKSLDF